MAVKRKDGMSANAPAWLYQAAELLREHQTPAEISLWEKLKLKPQGIKFRRQHPFACYIVDFYCHSAKLAIEIDGGIHEESISKENDMERELRIRNMGLDIIRFTNDQVLENVDEVVKTILQYIENKIGANHHP